ncbi:MAG: ROK family transcriptional regulator [Oscillospiraceae bacterium]|nr:ROK family transcriptional regulator [Oscillospiraceae bacterium]
MNMKELGISKRDLKRRNRLQVLKAIREIGPVSRVDIAERLCITRAAVTVIVNEMIEIGMLKELGEEVFYHKSQIHKGRRKVLIDFEPTFCYALGVHIAANKVAVGISTVTNETMGKRDAEITGETSKEEIIDIICNLCSELVEYNMITFDKIVAMGIGVMPEMAEKMGVAPSENLEDYDSLKEIFEQRLNVPVFAANAVPLLALETINIREHMQVPYNMIMVAADNNGYHLGAIFNNEIREEYLADTCSINKMCVNPGGRIHEGYCNGSVMAELTPYAIGYKASDRYCEALTPSLYEITGGNGEYMTLAQMLTAIENGDTEIEELTSTLLHEFCLVLNNLKVIYNAEKICLYDFGFSERNMDQLRTCLIANGFSDIAEMIEQYDKKGKRLSRGCCAYAIQRGFFQNCNIMPVEEDEE